MRLEIWMHFTWPGPRFIVKGTSSWRVNALQRMQLLTDCKDASHRNSFSHLFYSSLEGTFCMTGVSLRNLQNKVVSLFPFRAPSNDSFRTKKLEATTHAVYAWTLCVSLMMKRAYQRMTTVGIKPYLFPSPIGELISGRGWLYSSRSVSM